MNLLFDLSKEHPTLPKQEIHSILESNQIQKKILFEDVNVLILDVNQDHSIIPTLTKHLSLTHSISEYLCSFPPDHNNSNRAYDIPTIPHGSIAIRYRNRSNHDSQTIIRNMASIFTKNRTVDLENPDHEIYTIITEKKVFVGRLLSTINRKGFDKRKAQYRPFFSPISLHPRLARALVNVAHVTSKDMVLDPFCGTGGFLIEAGLIGCTLYGSDIQKEMIEGTKINLDKYHITPEKIFLSDIGEISDHLPSTIDAVITDAPYGKSTTTKQESPRTLYPRAIKSMANVIKPNGYLVIGLPDPNQKETFQHHFHLCRIISIPVHRSLTRYFYVGRKKQP